MPSITCPHCARVGSAKVMPPPGAKVRCPGCGERFEMSADVSEAIDLAPDLGPTTSSPAAPFDPSLIDAPEPPGLVAERMNAPAYPPVAGPPPEPWFYRWLDKVAGLLWYLALGMLVLAALGASLAVAFAFLVSAPVPAPDDNPFAPEPSGGLRGLGIVAGMVMLGTSFLSLLPLAIASALIRLAVDHARNVRAMRYR